MSLVSVQSVAEHNIDRVRAYLIEHLHCSMFLLSNLETYGPNIGDHFNSGNFRCVYNTDKLSGVFCLTARGNMLITADKEVLTRRGCELILDHLVAEPVNIKGLLGAWNAIEAVSKAIIYNGIWQSYSYKSEEETFIFKGIENKGVFHKQVRRLQREDFSQWSELRLAYLEESNLQQDLSPDSYRQSFDEMTQDGIVWGFFEGETLVAITSCNSKVQDIFQVGGVYTRPAFRSKGIAQKIVLHQLADMVSQYNSKVAILFTGKDNAPAQRVYSKIGFQKVGSFGIIAP